MSQFSQSQQVQDNFDTVVTPLSRALVVLLLAGLAFLSLRNAEDDYQNAETADTELLDVFERTEFPTPDAKPPPVLDAGKPLTQQIQARISYRRKMQPVIKEQLLLTRLEFVFQLLKAKEDVPTEARLAQSKYYNKKLDELTSRINQVAEKIRDIETEADYRLALASVEAIKSEFHELQSKSMSNGN